MNMPELNEISWGVHEGKVGDLASAASYKTMINHWQSENYDACIEGGESAAELAVRVSSIITFLKDNHHKYTNVLLCTHGRTLLCLLTLMNEMPLRDMNFFKHNNTCLYKCHFVDGEFIFELENDLKHLGNLPMAGF